jgi:localization factor PodJL
MSGATKRNALAGLDSLGAEARAAVRKAARHAGMSLEEWLAAVSGEATPPNRAAKRPPADSPDELDAAVAKLQAVAELARKPAGIAAEELEEILARASEDTERRTREQAAKTAVALDSVASWIERAEDRLSVASRSVAQRQERTAEMLGQALGTMTRRLDDIERKLASGRQPSLDAALKAVERIEARLAKNAAERDPDKDAALQATLRGFEDRIAELANRIAVGRPAAEPDPEAKVDAPRPGPGPGPRTDVRAAIAEIRARQTELDQASSTARASATEPRTRHPAALRSHEEVLETLRSDITRLAGQLETLKPDEVRSREIERLRSEIERLRATVGGLATREDVIALERSLRGITEHVGKARSPADLAAVGHPIEELKTEVRRIAELVATGVHGRLTRDVEGIAGKIDAIAGAADPRVVEGLSHQLSDLRRLIGEMAEPQRVHALAAQFAELNERVAELSRRQLDANAVERRFDALARQLDGLSPGPSDDISGRIDALSDKLDRLGEKPRIAPAPAPTGIDTVVQRLDRLDETLNRGSTPQLGSIEEMLRTLVDRVDQVGRPGADVNALDSLDKQVSILARRLERGPDDPELAGLERAMGDLMSQVELMRAGAYDTAERAAKAAVADTLASLPAVEPELGFLKRDLDELKTQQLTTDRRMQTTLESVHAALEKVVARLATLETGGDRPGPASAETIDRPTTIRVKGPSAQRSQPPKVEAPPQVVLDEADRPLRAESEEILLEPGAARPRPGSAPAEQSTATRESSAEVRANLIAAARRAVQAATAEAEANAKDKAARPGGSLRARAEGAKASIAARMKGVVDKHRRPILLGLAAIVLALGALRMIGGMGEPSTPPAAPPKAESRVGAPSAAPATPEAREPVEASRVKPAEGPAAARPDEPRTTQAIPSPAPAKPETPPAPGEANPDRASALTTAPKAPVMTLPPDAGAPLQIAPAAPAAPARTGAIDPRLLVADPIPNMSAVGELPSAPGLNGLRHAALAGDPVAVYEMAARLAEGRGFPRDLKLAAKLFEKAAANGLVPAQYRVGNHYEKALGVTRDIAIAKAWYQRAADKGNARAMHNLAVLLAEGAEGKPDYAAAAEWFRKAAEHGVKDSQFNLAVLLARGLGVAQNLGRSYTWFAIVAGQGDEDAGKKRDEVGARLAAAELSAARASVDSFKPIVPERAANEVAVPAQGWAEPAPAPAKKAPASAQRPAAAGKRV